MATQYDYYRELVRTRRGVEWNALISADISASLGSIQGEIEAVRRVSSAALAIQQELLNRELIQARLEEFIYQAGRMVDQFESAGEEDDPSTKYFLLTGLLETVRDQGLSTAIIRGRDNKSAFDAVLGRATELRRRLSSDGEVRRALAWAEEEQQKAIERQRRSEEELQRQEQRRVAGFRAKEGGIRRELEEVGRECESCESEKAGYKRQIATLRSARTPSNFQEWYAFKFEAMPIVGQAILWIFYGFAWIPLLYLIGKGNMPAADPERNAKLAAEIGELRGRDEQVEVRLGALRRRAGRLLAELESVLAQIGGPSA